MRAVVALVGAALVACAGGPSGSGADEVVFQASGDPEETAVYERLVAAFERAHPDVDVRFVPVADKDDHLARLTTSFTGGNAPDVFLVNFREYSQFVARGALEPVEPHLDDAGVSIGDYYPQPVEAFTYDGALQCMPQNVSSLVVYYNVALFEDAGVSPPLHGWTWEDFRRTALALTSDGVWGVGIEPSVVRLAPFVWSNGGELVDDLRRPTRFTLGEPAARAALEFVVGLARDDGVVPAEEDVAASEDLENMFATGRLAMYLSSRRDTPVFREIPGLRWDVGPLPQAREPAGILHSDGYCLADGGDVEAAMRFVAFATGRRGQTITARGGRTVPSLRSVAQSPAFLDAGEPPANSQAFLAGIPYVRRTPVIPTWPEIEDVAEEILTRAFYDPGYTIDRALGELDAQTTPLFTDALP
ncbi:MAG TPA: sugar ABC transporter substrate-binding protein [Actinomycetota bacterium]|nr:sugar ABC transporter substrate-binding protein [Actinomycetota bacterium]